MKSMSKILLCGALLISFSYAVGDSSGTVKHRKVFTTTTIGEHLTKEEEEALRKQKEAKAVELAKANAPTGENNSSAVRNGENESSAEVDNRTPIEKITGKKAGIDEADEVKQVTNPIVDITRQAPVISKEMRESFKSNPSMEFKP